MRLITFCSAAGDRLGVLLKNDRILDLQKARLIHASSGEGAPPSIFDSLTSLIEAGETGVAAARQLADMAEVGELPDATGELSEALLLAPIPKPRKNVFCVGRNYVEHVNEGYRARGVETKLPEFPQFFTKPQTTIIGAGAPIPLHADVTEKLDYEVELGVIIGQRGTNITEAAALDHIFGFTIINDITARDLQRRHDQWFKGKALDGSCPIGPWVVLREKISNPQSLDITLRVNGEVRQQSNTARMIFSIARLISELSQGLTLEPGDIIATGTPSGVGYAMDPPNFLKAGDVVSCEIEGIGTLENRVN